LNQKFFQFCLKDTLTIVVSALVIPATGIPFVYPTVESSYSRSCSTHTTHGTLRTDTIGYQQSSFFSEPWKKQFTILKRSFTFAL